MASGMSSGRSSEKLNLLALQSKMKCDPQGYESELLLIRDQFKTCLTLFRQQAAMGFTSLSGIAADPSVAKDLADRVMFLAHLTPFYPDHLSEFPNQLSDFLFSSARSLPSSLRLQAAHAIILLVSRKILNIGETLPLFMHLQTLGDHKLKQLAFLHVVHTVKRMNQKHKNEAENRALQNVLFSMLQQEDEVKAKRALVTLCDLHRRKVWFDDRTANAICTACFHSSPRIMVAALSFLLDYEKIRDDADSDDSSSEDEFTPQKEQIILSKEAVYKAQHKGTVASKKKKKAKLQRVIRSMKKQQRLSSGSTSSNQYSPLNHLKDAQGFVEKLFSRIQTSNERFKVKMMMLKVISRAIGLHSLILLNFYPFLQKYIQPHQDDVINLLAAAVQACHDMVPPDAVESLFRQIVNQFIHDGARSEAISVGLNAVREICLRMPLLMTDDLLQDLVLYKKSHEKAVSIAARSLITLFRELHPSLLHKKDRGRVLDPKRRPNSYGEVNIATDVAGIELLQQGDNGSDEDIESAEDPANVSCGRRDSDEDIESAEDPANVSCGRHDSDEDIESAEDPANDSCGRRDSDVNVSFTDDDLDEDFTDSDDDIDESDDVEEEEEEESEGEEGDVENQSEFADGNAVGYDKKQGVSKAKNRKVSDFDKQLELGPTSLRALKRVTMERMNHASPCSTDGILADEDFKKIKQREAEMNAKMALTSHGLKRKASEASVIGSSDQISNKRVHLESYAKTKRTKEEKLQSIREGREGREKFQARAAIKQKKTGGLSNRQKEHKKAMPIAAKRAKVARSRQDKKRKQAHSGKQFRGRKAWKS